jgi:protein-disulfide isomerase
MRSTILASTLLGLVLTGCASPTEPHADSHDGASTPKAPPVSERRHKVPLAADDHLQGGAEPLVTIVVFSDYACPPCGRAWQVLDHLVEDYGADLRVVFRSLTVPGFADGEQAAEAAFAAGAQGQFWPMHRRLFAESPPRFDRATLKAHAEALEARRAALPRRPRPRGVQRAADPAPPRGGRPRGVLRAGRAGQRPCGRRLPRRARAGTSSSTRRSSPPVPSCARAWPAADLYAAFQAEAVAAPIELEGRPRRRPQGAGGALRRRTSRSCPPTSSTPRPGARYQVSVGDAPAIGPVDAPVQIVAFMDFECPLLPARRRGGVHRAAEELRRRRAHRLSPPPAPGPPRGGGRGACGRGRRPQGQFWPFADKLLADETRSLGRSHLHRHRPRRRARRGPLPRRPRRAGRPPRRSARTCSSRVASASPRRRRSSSTAATSAAFATSRRSSPRSTPSSRPRTTPRLAPAADGRPPAPELLPTNCSPAKGRPGHPNADQ